MRLLLLTILVAVIGCGKKDEEAEHLQPSESAPATQPTTPNPTTTDATVTVVPAPIWVASSLNPIIRSYTTDGKPVSEIDLSTYLTTGSVTSLTFYDRNTLLVTADPGASGERIMRIDLKDNSMVGTPNLNWYQDTTNLSNITMYKLVKWSNSKLIGIKNAATIEAINYNIENNIAVRLTTGANPFIISPITTGAASCTITTGQVAIPVVFNNVTKLLSFSSGVNNRINLYDGIDGALACHANINYAGGIITATHVPTGAVQTSDGKIYVRYQFTSAPAIVRYDYDGMTLTNPVVVFSDSSVLNPSLTDREMVALNDTTLLVSNWSTRAIYKVDISTVPATAKLLVKDLGTRDVNAIAIRP